MNNMYTGNMYLNKTSLNDIENSIYDITNTIQEEIFNNQQSPLRNIQVGDNLNGKTIYFLFPKDIYQEISGSDTKFIKMDSGDYFTFSKSETTASTYYHIHFYSNDGNYVIYSKGFYDGKPNNYQMRISKRKMTNEVGTVTEIDTNNNVYQYVKIYDDETIIPNYVKHNWQDDEFLTMQNIDNLENGIKNIGLYYYKPLGWLENRQWLVTLGINNQNISYQDLNRWVTDLNLINFDNLDELTIWNSDITQLIWNENSDIKWEEL